MPPRTGFTTFASDRLRPPQATAEEINAANEFLANASTPQDQTVQTQTPAPTTFEVPVQEEVTSDMLQGGVTLEDARAELRRRIQADTQQRNLSDFDVNAQITPFDDPEAFLRSQMYGDNEPTQAEEDLSRAREERRDLISGTDRALTQTERRAREEIGLAEEQRALADIREKRAQRQQRFRREMRAMETDSERRGVSRTAYQGELAKMESDAIADLADYAIVEQALQGNVAEARQYIDTAVNNRYRSIQLELQLRQAELEDYAATVQGEEKERALQMQIALQERERNLAIEREDAKTKRELALQAAANGAGQAVIGSIVNASSVDTAITSASPYIGLLERQAAARAAQNARFQNRMQLIELAMMGDKDALSQLGELGESIQAQLEEAQTTEERERVRQVIDAGYQIQENLNIAERIANSPAFGASTGTLQNQFGTTVGANVAAGAAVGTAFGGIVGTGVGAAAGVASGLVTYNRIEREKENLFNDVAALTSQRTLQTLIDAKASGATFGALSETELDILIDASSELAAATVTEPGSGRIIGFSGSPEDVQRRMDTLVNLYRKSRDDNARNILTPEEKNAIYKLEL